MTLNVGGAVSTFAVGVLVSKVVSGVGLRDGFLVFGGKVTVAGKVDFVFVETFLE